MEAGIEIAGVAFNGEEACLQALEAMPDVILMDIDMPVLDGIDATRRIRQEMPSTEICMLTVMDDNPHLFDALKAGARGYLLKNAPLEEVANAVRAVAAG